MSPRNPAQSTAKRSLLIQRACGLTPVEKRGDYVFKRDDLFRTHDCSLVNGGKSRQALMTLLRDSGKGVITGSSLHSPQIPIVADAAAVLGRPFVAVVGGTAITPELTIAADLGARVHRAKSGRQLALAAEIRRLNAKLQYTVIGFGMRPAEPSPDSFEPQSRQTANLPAQMPALVVTCGSGISLVGILLGLWRHRKQLRELIIVETAPPRLVAVKALFLLIAPAAESWLARLKISTHSLFQRPEFRYEQNAPFEFEGIRLHPRYEAKAFRHVMKTTKMPRQSVFWIVGGPFSASIPSL